jgi:cytoskeletal protein RodZ
MSESFDAYHDWLGIAPKDQPPNHYRLLGIDLYEDKAKVIDSAVDRQMAHLRTFQTGPRAKHCEELLNKVSAGRVTLLDPEKKAAYDAELRDVLDAKPARAPLQVAQTLPLDVSVPSATLSFDTPQVHSTSSRRRENQKKGPPRMALAVGALLLGAVALIAAITMMGGGEEQRAQQPTNRPVVKEPPVRPPKSVALNTETEPGETTPPTATAGNFDEPLDIEPPQSETTGAATTQQTTQQDEQPANDPANTAPENNTPPENDPALKNDEAAESTEVASGDESPPDDSPRNRLPNDEPEPVAVNPEKRLAIPATAALKTAKTEIRSVFDLKAANDVESRIKLTQQILTTAMEAGNDPATQYAMLEIARDMSVHLGDYATAERVIDEMDKRFDVDAIAMRSKAVVRAMTAKVTADQRAKTASVGLALAKELQRADRYQEAATIIAAVVRLSGRLKNKQLAVAARQLTVENRGMAKQYEAVRGSRCAGDAQDDAQRHGGQRRGRQVLVFRQRRLGSRAGHVG